MPWSILARWWCRNFKNIQEYDVYRKLDVYAGQVLSLSHKLDRACTVLIDEKGYRWEKYLSSSIWGSLLQPF
jgi:hypothetical protein